ncbi:MAG: hypothetical protein IJM43_04145 [Bacteroidaceae bacterium]|nr:hypothetical protein [Bacteroidaceae bacterium]
MNNYTHILFLKKKLFFLLFSLTLVFSSCHKPLNPLGEESRFDEDGYPLDTLEHFSQSLPNSIKFYVEVSGSMNGFFRGNQTTNFKRDVWSVFSNNSWVNSVFIYTSQNKPAEEVSLDVFRTRMNNGSFVSTASTHVPYMISSLLETLDWENGEVAVLVSDMKYSPTGQKDMNVLIDQYASDIRNVFESTEAAVSLIGATSNYIDNKNQVWEDSPYYFLVIGRPDNVVLMRNCIATLLEDNDKLVGEMTAGIDYKSPNFVVSRPYNIIQLDSRTPSFYNFEQSFSDTCSFDLAIDLSSYPWYMATDDYLKDNIKFSTMNSSSIQIKDIHLSIDNHYERQLKRSAIAVLELSFSDMFTEADVVEFTLDFPIIDPFGRYEGAISENEYDKSFSIEGFIRGCFQQSKPSIWSKGPSRILITTRN